MKRFLIACAATLLAVVAVNAQPRAIGGRLAYGVGFSYQHSVGMDNMLSLDVDFPGYTGGIAPTVTYDWIFPITAWTEKGEWNWYAGVGGGLGFLWPETVKYTGGKTTYGGFYFGVAGRIGVEYNFWFPLQLSVDWRPLVGPGVTWSTYRAGGVTTRSSGWGFNSSALYASAICIGVRYRF